MFKLLKKRWKAILAIFIIIAIVVYIFNRNNSTTKSDSIKKGKISEELTLSGEINALNYAKLSFEGSGKIIYVGVKEGDFVKRGKLLSKLDSTVLNSSYQIAMSNLRLYEATLQNIYDQVKDHSGDETYAQKDLRTTAEVNKDKAYEQVLQAKRNLDGASLIAPFNGIVTYLAHPFPYVYTTVGSVEAEIIDPSTIYFSVLADQTEVTKLKTGQVAQISLDPFEGEIFEGIITNISYVPKAGEAGTTYSIKVAFNNLDLSDTQFKVAMSGDAKFTTATKDNVFYVPTNYVKQDKNGQYLKTDSKKGKMYIKSGIESDDYVEVISQDLYEGMTIYD